MSLIFLAPVAEEVSQEVEPVVENVAVEQKVEAVTVTEVAEVSSSSSESELEKLVEPESNEEPEQEVARGIVVVEAEEAAVPNPPSENSSPRNRF